MGCTVTIDGPCQRTLRFSIERSVLERHVEDGVRHLARTTRFKGFRPGHAPLDLVRRTHGPQLAEDARRQVMSEAFSEAIRENELRPVGDPEMNLEVLQDDGSGPFTFEFRVEVAPEFELGEIEGVEVAFPLPPVDDEMIGREVERLREQAATLEDAAADATVEKGDILHATIDGESDRPVFTRHDIVDGKPVEGSGDLFVGKKVGDAVEVDGRSVTIDKHQKVVVPPLTDELLQRVGVKTEDELRDRIREGLSAQREQARQRLADEAIQKELLGMHAFELPENLLKKAIDRRVHEYAHRLVDQQGVDPEQGHTQAEEQRSAIAEVTRSSLRASFIFARIAREKSLGATADEAEAEVAALARSQGEDENKLIASARSEGWISDVASQITEQKVREWLRSQAKITVQEDQP